MKWPAFSFAHCTYGGDPEKSPTKDEVLDDITLYWLTNSGTSAARLYWENAGRGVTSAAAQKTAEIWLPVAITVFPDEVYRAPERWAGAPIATSTRSTRADTSPRGSSPNSLR